MKVSLHRGSNTHKPLREPVALSNLGGTVEDNGMKSSGAGALFPLHNSAIPHLSSPNFSRFRLRRVSKYFSQSGS